MKRNSSCENEPVTPRASRRSASGLSLATACLVTAVLSVVAAATPATAQSTTDVRPSSDRSITLSSTNDSDGDRVVDSRDMCPGTPEGWSVKHNGCPVYQKTSPGSTTAADGGVLSGVTKIALNSDILFATSSAQITPQGKSILTRFANELKESQHPREIRLSGYADLTGRWAANMTLSQRRADAVRQHLIEQGIAASTMKAVGYGSAAPIVQCPDSGTRAERATCLAPNRRVEIEVRQLSDGR